MCIGDSPAKHGRDFAVGSPVSCNISVNVDRSNFVCVSHLIAIVSALFSFHLAPTTSQMTHHRAGQEPLQHSGSRESWSLFGLLYY